MFLTNHSSAFLLNDVRVVKNVACLISSLLTNSDGMYLVVALKSLSKLIDYRQGPRKIDNWGGTYSYIRVHRL